MCNSDKQNMAPEIENLVDIVLSAVSSISTALQKKGAGSKNKEKEIENKRNEIEKVRKEIETKSMKLKNLVKDLSSIVNGECSDSTPMSKLTEAENCGNIVHLSVTGLTKESLKIFWDTLEKFHNLTSLSVAMIDHSVITLPEGKDKLKKLKENLKRLRMESSHSGLKKLGEFGKLNDLTLASHINMDIGEIPNLPELLCLRLSGLCQKATCKIEFKGCSKLTKLVIGDMKTVERVEIGSAVLKGVVTLKFSNLPKLDEVAYTDEQPSDKHHSLLRWRKSTGKVYREVQPKKTIFLKHFKDFPVENSKGLEIYKYDMEMQCYQLKAT